LEQVLPAPTLLPLRNVHLIGPFENQEYVGLDTAYPPEQGIDLTASYPGKTGTVSWRPNPALGGVLKQPINFGAWTPTQPWSVVYLYAEIEAPEAYLAQLVVGSQAWVHAWFNGQAVLSPTMPFPANPQDSRAWVARCIRELTHYCSSCFSLKRNGAWNGAARATARPRWSARRWMIW
jgi:hypothetical protein